MVFSQSVRVSTSSRLKRRLMNVEQNKYVKKYSTTRTGSQPLRSMKYYLFKSLRGENFNVSEQSHDICGMPGKHRTREERSPLMLCSPGILVMADWMGKEKIPLII